MNYTIVNYYGKQTRNKCGYCKEMESSNSHGMHAFNMFPKDYQDLIDRGWRRSGHYCYKPHNDTTCCPSYTIRCDALDFKLSKSHKKVLKRMNRFLRDGKRDKSVTDMADQDNFASGGDIQNEPKAPNVPLRNIDVAKIEIQNSENIQVTQDKECSLDRQQQQLQSVLPSLSADKTVEVPDCPTVSNSGDGRKISSDSLNPPCKKAKQVRLERWQAKLAAKGLPLEMSNGNLKKTCSEKSLAEFINQTEEGDKHKLKTQLVYVKSAQFVNTQDVTYALYEKYQTRIHNDPPDDLGDYLRFLQRSPLQYVKPQDGPTMGYGSFHQQYWLDDQLIAVGVIDILPSCVSSVYFFYDPDYSFLSLGTYGSLREIEFVQQLAKKVPAIKYYYMGFYIHSCPKMRYKGKLVPSYLLCPEAYTWHLLTDATRAKLDNFKYQRFNADPVAGDKDAFNEAELGAVLLLLDNNQCMTYRQFLQIIGDEQPELRELILEYGSLVGKPCAHRMIFVNLETTS